MKEIKTSHDYMNNYPSELNKQARELLNIIRSESNTYKDIRIAVIDLRNRPEYINGKSKSLIDEVWRVFWDELEKVEV